MQPLSQALQKELREYVQRLRERQKEGGTGDVINEVIDELARQCRRWYRARSRGETPMDVKGSVLALSKRVGGSAQRRPGDTQRLIALRRDQDR